MEPTTTCTETFTVEDVAAWCRAFIEKYNELTPFVLLNCPDGLYAVDVRAHWSSQQARADAINNIGVLLGFGLNVQQFIAPMDTWIRGLDKPADWSPTDDDLETLMSTLPDAQDDPNTREGLLISWYNRDEPHMNHSYQQLYTREVTLDGTTYTWEEPSQEHTELKDYTFGAFWEGVAKSESWDDPSIHPARAAKDGHTLEEHMAAGRKVALAMADKLGLRWTSLAPGTLQHRA